MADRSAAELLEEAALDLATATRGVEVALDLLHLKGLPVPSGLEEAGQALAQARRALEAARKQMAQQAEQLTAAPKASRSPPASPPPRGPGLAADRD